MNATVRSITWAATDIYYDEDKAALQFVFVGNY